MPPAIQVEQVTKQYRELRALDGIDLEVQQGEFFGLLGPNGAGKTTLISIIAGLAQASSGRARVMGYDVRTDYRQARRAIGVVPQELVMDPFFTVRETLQFQSGYFGIKNNSDWIDEVIEQLDLTDKANTNMRKLSGGMKRRVLVAQALVHKPPVIILDEPTAGVDVELRQGLWRFIRRLNADGHTIILTTHYLEEAQALCGRIAMLKQGRVVALDETKRLLQKYSGCTVDLRLNREPLPLALQSLVVRSNEGLYRLNLKHYMQLEQILAQIRLADMQVLEMEVMQPDLEAVFVHIMQGTPDVE
jgi:ABC-2 type transport system ATP-binding protein